MNILNSALKTWFDRSENTLNANSRIRGTATRATTKTSIFFGIALITPLSVVAADSVYDVAAGIEQIESGNLSGVDGLRKQGAGTLQLTGVNTYTGITTVTGGNLRVENGGQITATNHTNLSGDNASVTVSGVGSKVTSAGATVTSVAGSILTVEKGGEFANSSILNIATAAGSSGTLNVTGAGSLLTSVGITTTNGNSQINVTDGGRISNGSVLMGFAGNGSGTILISGAGSRWDNVTFYMTSGSLSILDGGVISSSGNMMISTSGATKTATSIVSGAGSQMIGTGSLQIGTSGTGTLTLAQGGVASFASATVGSKGAINIGGAVSRPSDAAGTLNVPTLSLSGMLNFNHGEPSYDFLPIISGNGTINQNGSGLTRLSTNNAGFSGTTNVNAGTLSVNGVLGGAMNVRGGRLQGTGYVGDTTNFAGGIIAPGNSIGTLLIRGNYSGSGGILEMEGILGGAGSTADRLLITGNATGTTVVNTINTGGSGALTGFGNTDGMSIIQVAGASSANTFQLAGGYVAAGPYQYQLRFFDSASSAAGEVDPLLGAVPFNDYRLQSVVNASGNPVAVPQIAGYQALPTGAVRYGASLLDSVHKRLGELRQLSAAGGKSGELQNDEFFMRAQGSSNDVSGNRASGYDQSIWYVQAGGNVFGKDMDDGATLRIGGAISFGESNLDVDSTSAKVSLQGTTAAVTTTYQAAAGWYLDGVAQLTKYASDIKTSERGQTAAPDGLGYGISLEGGYPFDFGNGLILEPQAQLSYQKIKFDTFTDVDRIAVNLHDGESLRGRVGGRIQQTIDKNTDRSWTPFIEANLIHEFLGDSSINASGIDFASDSIGTSAQLGGGINAQVGANKIVFASMSYEKGLSSSAADAWGGNIGMRIDF